MAACALCDLPTPDPPVTGDGVSGAYCCRGCLEVARRLEGDGSTELAAERSEVPAGPTNRDGEAAFLAVSGMHCPTCEAFLEARATAHDGVLAAEASYPAGLVRVVFDPDRLDRAALPSMLSGTGYRASPAEGTGADGARESLGRLLVGGFLGMMVMVWYALFLYPTYLGVEPGLVSLSGSAGTYLLANVWVMSTVVLGYAGYPRLRGAYVSLRAGVPNMDLLVALAVGAAYLYSTAALLAGRREVYFDVVVAVVVVVALGKYHEDRVRRRAAGHLADLASAGAATARRRTTDGVESVDLEALEPGDEVVVRAGERVPVDGVVAGGPATVDESLLTGRARPRTVETGEAVQGGATVLEGALVLAVGERPGSRLERLLDHLWSVQTGRSGTQRLADRASAVFVPLAVALALGAGGWRLAGGAPPRAALLAGLVVLVVACPCALGLATPLAVSRGVREALEAGVVVTDDGAFERAGAIDVVAVDKTGTLTVGEMRLLDVVGGEAVIERAAAVEQFSTHPVASAVLDGLADRGGAPDAHVEGFEAHPGRGVAATVDGERVLVGSRDLLAAAGLSAPPELSARAEAARERGHLPAFVAWGGAVRGLLVAGDRPRPGWEALLEALGRDRSVVVLTGDEGAAPFGDHPAVADVFEGVPPEAKAATVRRLRARGGVAMVGDGTNDASALAAADLGVAIERGAPLAADAADVVVTTGEVGVVPAVFDLLSATRRRVRWNLGWAFGYNAVALPAALLGVVTPLLAAAAMAGSSLLVVGNSARRLGPLPPGGGTDPGE